MIRFGRTRERRSGRQRRWPAARLAGLDQDGRAKASSPNRSAPSRSPGPSDLPFRPGPDLGCPPDRRGGAEMGGPTRHIIREGDARDLSAIETESVHLVCTSPPYGSLKE